MTISGFAAMLAMAAGVLLGVCESLEIQEICESEEFHAKCPPNQVVLIRHARYGRMRQGRCITGVHGKLGCVQNARHFLDARCSGRGQCTVTVATLIPDDQQPCSRDLRSYLEVSYECVKVVNASEEYCKNSQAVEVKEQQGYLSNLVTMETGCGSMDCPWWVTVRPGQTIKLSLLDFSTAQATQNSPAEKAVCHVYAVIKEQANPPTTETVCSGNVREKTLFTSSTNRLEVRLVTGSKQSDRKDLYFLLRFEALGCPDLPQPNNGWLRRFGDDVTFGCDGERTEWALRCEGTEWKGDRHNCSEGLPMASGSLDQNGDSFINQKHGLSVLIILCIAVTVGLCILAVGLIHIKRRRRANDPRDDPKRRIPVVPYGPQATPDKPAVPMTRPNYNKTGDSTEFYHSSENDYYRTWQLQRHAPHQMSPPLPHYNAHAQHQLPPGCSAHASTAGNNGEYQKSTQSATEHIYESPKFDRKDYSSDDYEIDAINSEYFELDPDSNKTS